MSLAGHAPALGGTRFPRVSGDEPQTGTREAILTAVFPA